MADCERLARTGEQPADWATDLATTIIADAFGRRYTDALGMIAARLRLIKAEGEALGLEIASGLLAEMPRPKSYTSRDAATLQRQFQADHDQERAHGWADGESAA